MPFIPEAGTDVGPDMRLIWVLFPPPPASSPFPLLGLYPAQVPAPVPASAPIPAPVSVPALRWSLSQSPHRPYFPLLGLRLGLRPGPRVCFRACPRAGLCSNPGLGSRLCLGPDPLLSLLLFVSFVPASGYPKSLVAVFLLFFLDFSVFRSSPFLPCLLPSFASSGME